MEKHHITGYEYSLVGEGHSDNALLVLLSSLANVVTQIP